jgi:hypothetical protein
MSHGSYTRHGRCDGTPPKGVIAAAHHTQFAVDVFLGPDSSRTVTELQFSKVYLRIKVDSQYDIVD